MDPQRLSSDAINSQYDERLDGNEEAEEGLDATRGRPGSVSPSTAFHRTIAAARQMYAAKPSLSPVESLGGWERKSKLVLCPLSASFCSHFFAKAVWEVTNGCRFFFSLQKVYLLSNSNNLVQNTVVNGLSKGFDFYL